MPSHIALLRGINVGGHKRVPMADLRTLATRLGWRDVQTYIQSGNLVFTADTPDAENALESALFQHFGFPVDVVVRTAEQWRGYAAGTPFPEAEMERPHLLHLALARRPLRPEVLSDLVRYQTAGERAARDDDALWLDYPAGAGTTKITPTVLDRAAGSPVTTRNLRTVRALAGLLG